MSVFPGQVYRLWLLFILIQLADIHLRKNALKNYQQTEKNSKIVL